MKRLMLVLLLLPGAAGGAQESARAPGQEIAGISFLATGETRFPNPAEAAHSGQVRVQETEVLAPLGALSADPVSLAVAGWGGWTHLVFQDVPDLGTEDLFGAAAALFAEQPATVRWGWNALAMPGYFGEARFMAQAQAMRRFSNAWRLEAGLAYDDAFGDPQLFPVGGAVWQAADEWTVNLLFPASSIDWAPTRDLGLFTFLRPSGNRWMERDDEGKWIYVIEGWRAGLGLERRLWKHLWLRLEGGSEFARHYEVHHAGTRELDENADDTWFARAALVGY